MAFIHRIIGPDEKLVGIVTAHWIYGVFGVLWLLLPLAVSYGVKLFFLTFLPIGTYIRFWQVFNVFSYYAFWSLLALGGVLCVLYVIKMISTEIGLTTKRIIYKHGLIFTDVHELDIEEIKAADVDNGMLGRFLNYGYLIFDARFVGNLILPAIDDPYRFVKALNEVRSALKEDSMTIVLDGHGTGKSVNVVDQDGQSRKKSKQKEKGASGNKKSKSNQTEEPHSLEDSRYESGMDNDPARNLKQVVDDVRGKAVFQKRKMRQQKQIIDRDLGQRKDESFEGEPEKGHPDYQVEQEDETRLREKVLDSFDDSTHYKG